MTTLQTIAAVRFTQYISPLKNTSPLKVSLASSSFLETLVFVFLSEFQDLLYDVVRQGIVGALEIDEVVSFLNELLTLLVRSIFWI